MVFYLRDHGSSFSELGEGTQRRNWCRGQRRALQTGLLSHGLLNLICNSTKDHQTWGATSHSKQSPPTSIVKKKIHHRHSHNPAWWGHLWNWGLHFQNDSSLGQVYRTLASTIDSLFTWHINTSLLNHNLSILLDLDHILILLSQCKTFQLSKFLHSIKNPKL